jgi:TonB family protein
VKVRRLLVIAILLVFAAMATLYASEGTFLKPISSELPMYPEPARRAHVAGTVNLWFMLDGTGAVTRAQSVSGNSMLRDAALSTVKSWRFLANSMEPNVRYETEFVYTLEVQRKNGQPTLKVSMTDFRRVEIVSGLYVETVE